MGLAGLFPGVSAGTVALLLGIHGRLIHVIASIDLHFASNAWKSIRGDSDARSAIGKIGLPFIGLIFIGMLTTTFAGAKGVTWLQMTYPGQLMAVFLGLIAFGAVIPWRRIENPGWRAALMIIPGALVAVMLAFAPEGSFGTGGWRFFVGGLIAMPMMILPGVSGSALLVTIGLYADTIQAAGDFDVLVLLTFAAGGILGILSVAKGLRWLLDRYHGLTMGFLTGLLAGSLVRVWPWRTESGFAQGLPVWPQANFGLLGWTALAAAAIIIIEILSLRRHKQSAASVKDTDDEPYQ
jgi:putative membrane protein